MDTDELKRYITQSIDMALGSDMQGESSYTNSFSIDLDKGGIKFIPRMPAGYLIDDALYQHIFKILNVSLYPNYTLLKQNTTYFVPISTRNIHVQRALYFPWQVGIPRRLIITNLEDFATQNGSKIQIMKNLSIDYNHVTSIALAGTSGSGKSYFLTYLLESLKHVDENVHENVHTEIKFQTLTVIDPKMDEPSRWAKANGVKVIYPATDRSKSDFVAQINDVLSECLKLIHKRQQVLFNNPSTTFKHVTVVIDEVLALSEGINKNIKDTFFALLSQIALLGRATRVHLILVSQRFDHNSIPTSVREQMNVLVQLGNINRKTTQFLFPDLDPEGIVIPLGRGTGLIQVIDDEHPYQVLPLLCPTYYTSKEKIL